MDQGSLAPAKSYHIDIRMDDHSAASHSEKHGLHRRSSELAGDISQLLANPGPWSAEEHAGRARTLKV